MKFWRKPGGAFLATSVIFLLVMVTCTFTPVVWILTGSPDESYPELVFCLYGLPLGLLLVVAAGVRHWLKNRG